MLPPPLDMTPESFLSNFRGSYKSFLSGCFITNTILITEGNIYPHHFHLHPTSLPVKDE